MSTISENKQSIKRIDNSDVEPATCILKPATCILKPETWNLKPKQDEAAGKERLLVSMKEKAMLLRHLQEKDLVQGADAKEIHEILGDLDKTIKELETSNV